jgi:hypothetical protein
LTVDKKKVPMVPVVEFDLDYTGPIRLHLVVSRPSFDQVGATDNE